MKLFLKILLFLLLPVYLQAQPANAAFRNLTSADGLPTTSVTDITQDAFGFIWIGSWDNVYRYDGQAFKKIPSTSYGRYLTADHKGGVWISFSNSVGYYDPYTESMRKYNITNPGRYPEISLDDSGGVWVATDDGILHYNKSTNRFARETGQQSGRVYGLSARDKGELLFIYRIIDNPQILIGRRNSKGVYSYEHFPQDLNNPQKGKSFYDSRPLFVRISKILGTVIINPYGWAYKNINETQWVFKKPLSRNFSMSASYAILDSNNNIWLNQVNEVSKTNIVTGKVIVYKYDPKNPNSVLPLKTLFAGNDMFLDRQGILWITRFSQGISRLNLFENDFGLLKDSSGLPIPDVLSALELKNGSYWIGTRNEDGLIHYGANGKIIKIYRSRTFASPPGKTISTELSHPFVWALAESGDGSIWAGGGSPGPNRGGLSKIRPGSNQITRFKYDPDDSASINGNWITKIIVDGSDRVWINTNKGISYINPKTEKIIRGIKNVSSDDADYELELLTSSGNIIIGTPDHDKSYIIENKTLEKKSFGAEASKEGPVFYSDQDYWGKIWFIAEKGFGYLDSSHNKFAYFYSIEKKDFPANEIVSLKSDKNGEIWLASDNGIIQFNPLTEKFRHFGFERGLQGNNYSGRINYRGPSGKIYFGGNGGINIFDPEKVKTNPYPPKMVFTGLELDGISIKPGTQSSIQEPVFIANKIIVGPDVLTISIDFSAIHFAGYKDNHYQYKLEGFDKGWRDGGTIGKATYTNLSPGSYTLYIKGSNWDGVWSDGTKQITLLILPPWWRTWWAYSVYGLIFLFLLWRVDKYQKARTIRHEKERAQQRELEQAKEIEKAYEELKATQTQLIHSEKMASLGELTAGIAHEIKNPLNFVNNFSEVSSELLDELKSEIQNNSNSDISELIDNIRLNLDKITQHGKRADSIVKGMLLHSRGTSGEKALTDINDLLDQYVTLAYHGLRAQDKNFNITIEKDYDESIDKINVVPQDISRVFLNIINNACYAAYDKKKKSGDEFNPVLNVSTKSLKNKIEIHIRDNGNGIPEPVRKQIFNPFFTTKPTGEGTGLGLSLSYDIVTKVHGGEIKFESEEGQYTEFTIILPKQQSE